MKILYCALKYDYGKPDRGFSFEHYNFYDSLTHMSGIEVVYFPFDEVILEHSRDRMNELLVEKVKQEQPDLAFFSIFEEEFMPETIDRVSELTITYNWFCDDHWRFFNFSRHWAPHFDWVSTTDHLAIDRYREEGYENVIKTQWGCNHHLYYPRDMDRCLPVTFVGSPHGNRLEIIEQLRSAGVDVECWGGGWPSGRVSQDEMIEIYSASAINLNLTKSSSNPLIKTLKSVFSSRDYDRNLTFHLMDWPDRLRSVRARSREQIKGRNFEVPGCGGFLLTGHVDGLEEYYRLDEEVVCFASVDEMIEKAQYYLDHEDERQKIAERGHERTLADHTYEKRFSDIFYSMGFSSNNF